VSLFIPLHLSGCLTEVEGSIAIIDRVCYRYLRSQELRIKSVIFERNRNLSSMLPKVIDHSSLAVLYSH
jgi:hypothetical protein